MVARAQTATSTPGSRVDPTRPAGQNWKVTQRGLKRLSEVVQARRAKLGVTQEEFAARAGVGDDGKATLSTKTVARLERNLISRPWPQTLGAIDRAGGWPAGYAQAVINETESEDEPEAPAPTLPAILDADAETLKAIVLDRDKIGTTEWLEALGILLALDEIDKEAYVHALTVGRKVRHARKEAERRIADLQRSLTERVWADLSE